MALITTTATRTAGRRRNANERPISLFSARRPRYIVQFGASRTIGRSFASQASPATEFIGEAFYKVKHAAEPILRPPESDVTLPMSLSRWHSAIDVCMPVSYLAK